MIKICSFCCYFEGDLNASFGKCSYLCDKYQMSIVVRRDELACSQYIEKYEDE